MRKLPYWYALPFLLLISVGCTDTEPVSPTPTASYDSSGFQNGTLREYRLRSDFAAMVGLLKTARSKSVVLSQSDINAALAPFKSEVAPGFRDQLSKYALELAEASGSEYTDPPPTGPVSQGGVLGGYLFNEVGLEMEQMIDKGLYATLFYHQAVNGTRKALTTDVLHQLLALYGTSPRFPNSDRADVAPDQFVAGYCARRDQNNGQGMYSQIRQEFIRAQASINVADTSQTRSSVLNILRLWERSQMATVVNYTYSVVDGFSASNLTDSVRASAMHAYGECIGFLTGWRFIDEANRTITTAQIDELLALMKAPLNGPWTCYEIWKRPEENLARIVDAREMLQDIYGFTDEEMISFKTNWVAAQGRK